ncbi:MAG TPA: MOSC domain-containing protein [Gemmatimonadaceae bacterium]
MRTEIGTVEAIFRYPVKSMAGEQLDVAEVGLNGIEGDRRLALHKPNDTSGFPWLNASRVPELITFKPVRRTRLPGDLPSHVKTPQGDEMEIFSSELSDQIAQSYDHRVRMMHMRSGIFDAAHISVIATDTIDEIGRAAGMSLDVRRFRPNVVVRLHRPGAFQEDKWVGSSLVFGDASAGTRVNVMMHDERCAMINIDPDSAALSPEVLKSVVRINRNNAGVYCSVARTGTLSVGDTVYLDAAGEGG